MHSNRQRLELLSPAKDAEIGIEAINHGADAVYIGGPAFGARYGVGNSVAEIERLVRHAHRYAARVFVALNTILTDAELEQAHRLVHQLYDAGVDALIVQDMGLLELDLPPIQLHASTQTDIRSVEKARFLQNVGFSQIVLAREMSLNQIRAVAAETQCVLEYFVHGALCVAFSGQCFISHAHTGRSANRGECSQACRLPYTLTDPNGRVVAHEQHLLSMKDNDQSANLRALVEAGISSFKIEGRLKDLAYVKNITAHYRQLLDEIMEDSPAYRRSSSGRTIFLFTPQPDKTYNRGSTDYFVHERQHGIEAFDSPAFVGEALGCVTQIFKDSFELDTTAEIHNGDGLAFYVRGGKELHGMRINRADAGRLYPNEMPQGLKAGTQVYRNHDHDFEQRLQKKSAERRIAVSLYFTETAEGLMLRVTDEDGVEAGTSVQHERTPAQHPERVEANVREHLAKLGNTIFEAKHVEVCMSFSSFIPSSVLNGLRREAIAALERARLTGLQRLPRAAAVEPPVAYPDTALSYLGNVLNAKARTFYTRHGVRMIDAAYEANEIAGDVSLMITKHCLRYSFNLCPKELKEYDLRGQVKAEPMTLINGKERLTLRFDCKRCEMHVIGRMKKSVLTAQAQPIAFYPKSEVTLGGATAARKHRPS